MQEFIGCVRDFSFYSNCKKPLQSEPLIGEAIGGSQQVRKDDIVSLLHYKNITLVKI